MTKREILDNVRQLSRDEQVDLAVRIWEIVEPTNDELHLTEAQKAALDLRIEQFERNPQAVRPWDVVREEILRELREKR